MTIAYVPSSLLSPPTPKAGIETPTWPSGRPASLVTLPEMVTGSCAASRAGSARNTLRMMGTTRLSLSCMYPPTVSATLTTDLHHHRTKTRAHDDGGASTAREFDRDLGRKPHGLGTPISPILGLR